MAIIHLSGFQQNLSIRMLYQPPVIVFHNHRGQWSSRGPIILNDLHPQHLFTLAGASVAFLPPLVHTLQCFCHLFCHYPFAEPDMMSGTARPQCARLLGRP